MKKLSIDEKAKLYDEAINRMKRYVIDEYGCTRIRVTYVFPELKESEDERTWIINYLSNRILNSTIIAEKENLKKAIAWLEKQGEQKPAWSEEDEAILEKCIGAVKVSCYSYSFKSEAENWLKSLRPQNMWKPSEEQMEALRYVTNFDYGGHKATLVSLYEQLKKLKE